MSEAGRGGQAEDGADRPVFAIDIQTHHVPKRAAAILARCRREGPVHGIDPKIDPGSSIFGIARRLRAMDEAGIGVSVLSFAPVGGIVDRVLRGELCAAANDGLIEACARHPDRFVMAAMLPLPDAEAAAGELARIAGAPALRAVQITADATGYVPDHDDFARLFAAVAGLNLPVIIHPTAGIVDLAPQFDAYGLGSGMHAMVSHALVAGRMIQSGMLDRIPGLELILTHLGGILPFLIDRLDSRHRGGTQFAPSHYLRERVFLDNCGYPDGPALRCALDTVGAARILIGSDWPSRPIAPALDAVRRLGADARRAILWDNAARWFDPARSRVVQ